MKVGILGGGITGLTAAYTLLKNGVEAHVFERDKETGGIAGAVKIGDAYLEKYYHHFFKSDIHMMGLLKDLGLEEFMSWHESKMGFFIDNELFDFGTPISLIKFKPLPLPDKIRFGMTILKLLGTRDYKPLEDITAREWIIKNAGRRVYEAVWKPLLVSKFGDRYKEVSMAWFWGKIKLRGNSKEGIREVLGYIDGSTRVLTERLTERIEAMGGGIHRGCPVESIERGFKVKTKGESFSFDRVLSTLPLPVFLKAAESILPKDYREEKGLIEYTAVTCMVLILGRQFTDYYWLNMGDSTIPFGGLIEHTNFLDKRGYGGNHILYISNYVYRDSPYYKMDGEELLEEYMPHLKRINPDFGLGWVKNVLLFKDDYAQPVVVGKYSKVKPSFNTPVMGLYTASMCNIYPEDRGMNYAVRDGIDAAREILREVDEVGK